MIGRLRGRVLELAGTLAVIDVQGVGYEVELTAAAAAALAGHAGEAQVFIHHLVREDAQTLYGFATVAERDLFRTLIRMNGVGPKLGIAILGVLSPAELAQAVANGDSAAISRAPGVGARTAKRLILELRDRLDDFEPIAEAPSAPGTPAHEAVLALVALGYRRTEAAQAIDEVAHEGATVEVLVRDALRRMGSAA